MLSVDRAQARHYGDDHGRYWSVSQVCEVITGDRGFKDPVALQRGTDLHQIFALAVGAVSGLCEWPDVPDHYRGYYAAIERWIEHAKPRAMSLERTMKHKTLPYAGTSDFLGLVKEEFGVLDLKTGVAARWHSVQIHAYQRMTDKAARMWVLYIADDGTFQQVAVKPSARDWAVFQNGLSILQWRAA